MDQLSYYNDLEFSNNYAKYHNNDNSLICKNNVLYSAHFRIFSVTLWRKI